MTGRANTLLLFGATGDLAQRMLLPSLAALAADGLLPAGLKIIGTARTEMTDAAFPDFAHTEREKYQKAHRQSGLADIRNTMK